MRRLNFPTSRRNRAVYVYVRIQDTRAARDAEIQRLVKDGTSYRLTALAVGCSLRTVQKALMPPSARKAIYREEKRRGRRPAAAPVSDATPPTPTEVLERVARTGFGTAAQVTAARALLDIERVQDVERERDAAKETAQAHRSCGGADCAAAA